MGWDGPILTDSGGFQVFSLRDTLLPSTRTASPSARSTTALRRASRPSRSRRSRASSAPTSRCASTSAARPARLARSCRDAVRLTTLWAERQRRAPRAEGQLLFGIAQGSSDPELRRRSLPRSSRSTSTATRSAACPIGEPRGDARDTSPGRRRSTGSPATSWASATPKASSR